MGEGVETVVSVSIEEGERIMITVEQVDYVLAGSPNTPTRVLDRLARAAECRVRKQAAENPSTSAEALIRLAADWNVGVVAAAALNPSLPRQILEELTRHDSLEVRYAIADGPAVPVSVLLRLADDENPYISQRAMQTICEQALRG